MERFSGPRRYQIPLGSTVYIGTKPYEMQSLGETTVTLYDPEFPLFTQEFPRADFDRKLEENPLNEQYFLPDTPKEQAQQTDTRAYSDEYRLLDRPISLTRALPRLRAEPVRSMTLPYTAPRKKAGNHWST